MRYARALPIELGDELARKPVAYVPWGALEWHGEHLALGQDALKVERICDLTAERAGGVVLPMLFIGYRTMQVHGMPYTLEFSRELVKATFLELMKQLELVGFKVVVVLCGHYGQSHLAAVAEAAEEYSKTGRAKVLALPEYALVEDMGYRGDHAAKWETSIFSSLYPELVNMQRLPRDLNTPLRGIMGEDPRLHASRELGAKTVSAIVERLAQRVEAMLAQE